MSSGSRKTAGVLLAVCVGLTTGALATAAAGPDSRPEEGKLGEPASYAPVVASRGAVISVADAVEQVMSRLRGDTGILDVSVGKAPPEVVNNGSPWLTFRVAGASSEADGVKLAWQADLLQGAATEIAKGDAKVANQVIAGADIDLVADDGTVIDLGGAAGYVATGQDFGTPDVSDEQLVARVTETLHRYGLEVRQVEVLHPLEAAILVDVQLTSAEKPQWTIDGLRDALRGPGQDFEGLYIEIQGLDGEPLLRSGVAYRTGSGRLWFAPGADETFGAAHGGTAS
ncbi:MAG: hypothetical protein LH624_16325 [Cryobacterium sp.]|nr:hypothetical protein [Cryobacterium sp.]